MKLEPYVYSKWIKDLNIRTMKVLEENVVEKLHSIGLFWIRHQKQKLARLATSHCQWEWKLVQPPRKTVWGVLKELETELPHESVSHFRVLVWIEIRISERCLHSTSSAAVFATAEAWKHPKCLSMDELIEEMWYVYAQTDISQPQKNKK